MTARSITRRPSGPAGNPRRPVARKPTGRVRQTFERVLADVRRLVPADGMAFLLVTEDGGLEPVASWFAVADLQRAFEQVAPRNSDAGRRRLADLALAREGSLVLPSLEAWEAAPDLIEALRDSLGENYADRVWGMFARASVIACPVKSEAGRPLGVLAVASLGWPPLAADELRALEVLADVSALSLERAELLEAEGARGRRELLLARAAEDVSESLEPSVVYHRVVEHATRLTGATKASLARINPRESELAVVASVDFSPAYERRRFPVDRGMMGEVARTRRPYLSRAEDRASWDTGVVTSEGLGSFLHVPVELGPRLFGVLTLGHERPGMLGEDQLELALKLARSSAAAIANAMDHEQERRIARALTTGFVPESPPEIAGYDVGLLYVPAESAPVGGDVYGLWRLPGGELAILVGDVAGKGVETAALSSMVRFTIEARSWDTPCPATVLGEANDMLLARLPPDTFVTAFMGLLTEGSLRYANAGHVPPLLVREGRASLLGAGGLPLGVEPGARPPEGRIELGKGDLVLGYTDGLVEARREGELFGYDRLARLVEELSPQRDAQTLAGAVHEEVAGWAGGLSDDSVTLALRRRGGP